MFGFDFFELTKDVVTISIGLTAILASLGVILCSSPIYCALYLIGHMICLALLFLIYNAEFIAAVQIIVYAGSKMFPTSYLTYIPSRIFASFSFIP